MPEERRRILIQIGLFIATFMTTTLAGTEWVYGKSIWLADFVWNDQYSWTDFVNGMYFSVPFLLILTVHEFGHYFTAMYHKIRSTLPYYIPFPPGIFLSPGTMGAVIRIKDRVRSNRQHFDIGIAGPLAGFVVAVAVVVYGFATLPPAEYIYQFHPEYEKFGLNYADSVYTNGYVVKYAREQLRLRKDELKLTDEQLKKAEKEPVGLMDVQVGSTLLFELCKVFVADKSRIPNPHELMHYPLLLAGFFALFFTSLNLLPIGQLDGGHILYGLFGWRTHRRVASVAFVLLLFYAGLGTVRIGTPKEGLPLVVLSSLGIMVFYYLCFGALGGSRRDRGMYAVLMFAVQVLLTWVFPAADGYPGWMLFAFVVGRFVGVPHPHSDIEQPLDTKRVILGWISLLVFILSFTPAPLRLEILGG
ncbi:site-2 protease family protein [Fulvivirgaceae bacterium PWU5]|uniref:Site-2 protease family protein n=1 Tax=Dawidia cretensis TaxID=2782350 RepID=A0AAP2E353_9BACT|nr:site-2 protease family protein [Dawidia cretensis]MBT1712126.1 site-2 protease family protein [Dawidia cretensis]